MKKLFYFLLIFAIPQLSFADSSPFSYDKNELNTEFSQLNKVSSYIDYTNVSFDELSNSHIFDGKIELTKAIALHPDLKFRDVDWGAFALGFCCFPVGIFTILRNDNKRQESKNSFCIGFLGGAFSAFIFYLHIVDKWGRNY